MDNTNMEKWKGKGYSFYSNTKCEYFPCHATENPEMFNCLFCYCPLYTLGTECGGKFKYTKNGVKNCIDCDFPHRKENYGHIIEKLAKSKTAGMNALE
jgi:Zn-finger protein